jgi:hypothetical protein
MFAVTVSPAGDVGGFLHLAPAPAGGGWSLSTMRRRPGSPNGLTEFLVVETLAWAKASAATELSLNFCALADFLSRETAVTVPRRVVRRALLAADNVFQLERLHSFSRKFHPEWRARYLGERDAPGAVVLGIDPKVQKAASDALAATGKRGAIIALDPRTGVILASVSLPSYDANQIVDPKTEDLAWQQVNGDVGLPLIDRARSGLYPPGSTFKTVTGAAALENGVNPDQKVRVDDPWQADKSWGDYFVRSSSHAHADFTMADGYRLSENIYFAKIGLQIGGPKLAEYAGRFGIGTAPKCDLAAAKGQLSNTGTLDRPTLAADTAYGQGELLVIVNR